MSLKRCNSQKSYEEVITDLHNQILAGNTKLLPTLESRVKSWYDFLNISVQRPLNEQQPWTPDEIGFLIERMPLKRKSGYNQTGDYIIHIQGEDIDCTGGLVAERKSLQDWYGTVSQEKNRQRFLREITRFHKDDRFEQMVVFVEGGFIDMMSLLPPEEAGIDYKDMTASLLHYQHSMMGKMAKIQAKNVSIHWGGNRPATAKYYGFCVRHWVLNNYDKIIPELRSQNNE